MQWNFHTICLAILVVLLILIMIRIGEINHKIEEMDEQISDMCDEPTVLGLISGFFP